MWWIIIIAFVILAVVILLLYILVHAFKSSKKSRDSREKSKQKKVYNNKYLDFVPHNLDGALYDDNCFEKIHREIFFSADIPFTPSPDEVIYFESAYNEEYNKYIVDNLESLSAAFAIEGYLFRYFPAMTTGLLKHVSELSHYTGRTIHEYELKSAGCDFLLRHMYNIGLVQFTKHYDAFVPKLARPCKYTPENIHPSFIRFIGAEDIDGDIVNCTEDIEGKKYYRFSYFELMPVHELDPLHSLTAQIYFYLSGLQRYANVVRYRAVPQSEERIQREKEEEAERSAEKKMQQEAAEEEISDTLISTITGKDRPKPEYNITRPEISDAVHSEVREVDSADIPHIRCLSPRDPREMMLIGAIRKDIEKLLKMGVGEGVIRDLLMPQVKLSRLIVTIDYKIVLPDFDDMVICMAPLPKAVFILFLKHPEGIFFKEIEKYKNELSEIYMSISKKENTEEMARSIDNLVYPFSNSLNEKCSRVREAFLYRLSESVAEKYMITGGKGGLRSIALDRNLVIFE